MNDIRTAFDEAGQGHVFRFFDTLSEDQQQNLLKQAARIDLEEIGRLVETHVAGPEEVTKAPTEDLEPARYIPLPEAGKGNPAEWDNAREVGEEALNKGRVAAFTVAGGQGTRLGFDGPKGTFPVTPVRKKSLFQVFAERIATASKRYGRPVPWFIMTSVINHEATQAFFREHQYFGLNHRFIRFFSQGLMPAVDLDGRILLESPGSIALSPDGHGGSMRALVRSQATKAMAEAGIDLISYFQVDNPLVRCIDPAFIGFHLMNDSEFSSKAVPKAYPDEKVGVFCKANGKTVVVEYSNLPERLAIERDADGELSFRAGNVAIHLLSREFAERVGGGGGDDAQRLPFHRADKRIPTIDTSGNPIEPTEPNGVKFEMFVFDALPFARNPIIVEAERQAEFSPVKNAEGVDSPENAQQDQIRQWTRWLKAAGARISSDKSGLPAIRLEVSPLFADSQEAFVKAWRRLDRPPNLTQDTVIE